MATTRKPAAPKPPPEHKDKLGRIIKEGNFVAYPGGNQLQFGRVAKLNPKMIKVHELPGNRWSSESLKYPSDLLILEDRDMTWWLLKNPSKG